MTPYFCKISSPNFCKSVSGSCFRNHNIQYFHNLCFYFHQLNKLFLPRWPPGSSPMVSSSLLLNLMPHQLLIYLMTPSSFYFSWILWHFTILVLLIHLPLLSFFWWNSTCCLLFSLSCILHRLSQPLLCH